MSVAPANFHAMATFPDESVGALQIYSPWFSSMAGFFPSQKMRQTAEFLTS